MHVRRNKAGLIKITSLKEIDWTHPLVIERMTEAHRYTIHTMDRVATEKGEALWHDLLDMSA